jgi:D-alanyl-D-alanine carboxypeptidase
MDSFAKDIVQNTPLAGMTLAVRRQGDPDWIQAYGFANLEQSIPTQPDTVYQIGSPSMMFTAAAVMQLVEQGQLDLFTPINQYLEGLPPAYQSFNLDQLLSHTSLIRDTVDTQKYFYGDQNFTSEMLLQELVPSLMVLSSNDSPVYLSYGNYIIAGLILEKVSGLSYPDYLNQYIFSAAGLQHTSYCLPSPADMAQGYYMPDHQLEPLHINISRVLKKGSENRIRG